MKIETQKRESSPAHLKKHIGLDTKLNKANTEEEAYGLFSLINMDVKILSKILAN